MIRRMSERVRETSQGGVWRGGHDVERKSPTRELVIENNTTVTVKALR